MSWRRGTLVGLASAAAILLVVGLLPFVGRPGGGPTDTQTSTTRQAGESELADLRVAETFLDDWVAGDGVALSDMFGEGGIFLGWQVGPEQLPALHDWFRAAGWTFEANGCRLGTDPGRAYCTYSMEDDLLAALGRAPTTGTLLLDIADARVRRLEDRLDLDRYADSYELFVDWIERTASDDFGHMFNSYHNPLLDPAAIELWRRHTDDEALASFAADAQQTLRQRRVMREQGVATAEAFMAAWIAGDGASAARLFSSEGTYASTVLAGEVTPVTRLGALHEWYRATGWEFQNLGCRSEDVSTPEMQVVVRCGMTFEHELSRTFDWVPIRDTFGLVVGRDGIESATERFGFDAHRDLWFTFKGWVARSHPDDIETMYLLGSQQRPRVDLAVMSPPHEALAAFPRLDAASIALWEQRLDEFLSSVGAVEEARAQLEVARYVSSAVTICKEANDAFWAEVMDLTGVATTNFEQFSITVTAIERQASFSSTAARYGDEVVARLRALPAPDGYQDRLDEYFALLEQEIMAVRQVAAAARTGDIDLVEHLQQERIDATHQKGTLESQLGYGLSTCPVELPA